MESASKKEVTNFGNLIIKVTSYYLCHILFIRLKSLGPAHTKGERIRVFVFVCVLVLAVH